MNINDFVEIKKILDFFRPYTPYGKIYKENLSFFTDKSEIEKKIDVAQLAIRLTKNAKLKADRIKYYLKNIPYLDFQKKNLEMGDIFLYKKFLNNYFGLFQILQKEENNLFSLKWNSQELLDYLSISSKTDDFYISENYSLDLKNIREKITDINKKIETKKRNFLGKIKTDTGFDFFTKEFLLIDAFSLPKNSNDLYWEPYDANSCIVKPKFGEEILSLISEKERLIKEEKKIENEIKNVIIEKIFKNKKDIIEYSQIILDIDIAFATANMAIELSLSKPKLGGSNIKCKNAFFIPLKLELDELKIKYTPLSFDFKEKINVITGSNMGGKTIVLKTITQLQIMTQCGLYVPAKYYTGPIFKRIETTVSNTEITGLSSFAIEMTNLINIISDKNFPVLIIMDEFARTTNVKEGKAIFSALLQTFSESKEIYLLAATHFSDIKLPQNAEFLAMKGFNKNKFEKFETVKISSFIDKLKTINRCMDYQLIKTKKQIAFYDAINIASILGLQKDILKKALKNMEAKNE